MNENEILSTICTKVDELQQQIFELENRVSELEIRAGIQLRTVISEPIDIFGEDTEEAPAPAPAPAAAAPEVQEAAAAQTAPAAEPAEEASILESPATAEPAAAPKEAAVTRQTSDKPVITYKWETAKAASPLSNIMSGIALKDRGVFINNLFHEDPQRFLDTINAFNAMGGIAEAKAYVEENFPEWNLGSDIVFRLMMAVRRKLN